MTHLSGAVSELLNQLSGPERELGAHAGSRDCLPPTFTLISTRLWENFSITLSIQMRGFTCHTVGGSRQDQKAAPGATKISLDGSESSCSPTPVSLQTDCIFPLSSVFKESLLAPWFTACVITLLLHYTTRYINAPKDAVGPRRGRGFDYQLRRTQLLIAPRLVTHHE